MVKQCVVCHSSFTRGGVRSFHLLPSEPELKRAWLEIVGIADMDYPKYTYLCSDHFSSADYDIKHGGLKYLRRGSLPLPPLLDRKIIPKLMQENNGFPLSRPNILHQWLQYVGIHESQLSSTSFLCGRHFSNECFSSISHRAKLKYDAIPTVPYETYMQGSNRQSQRMIMEIEDDDDPMEIDDTVQSGQIIERRSSDFSSMATVMSSTGSASITDVRKSLAESDSSRNSSLVEKIKNTQIQNKDTNTSNNKNTNVKDNEVVILDDDDDDVPMTVSSAPTIKTYVNAKSNVPSKRTETKIGLKTPDASSVKNKVEEVREEDIIDLVERAINSKCINYGCKSGKDLMAAPGFCLSYYRVKCSPNRVKEVCEQCYYIAVNDYDKLVTQLKDGELLFKVNVPLRNDMVEIDDSDDEEPEQNGEDLDYIDEESSELIKKDIDDVIERVVNEFNLNSQVDKEVEFLKNKAKTVNNDIKDISDNFKNMRKTLDRIQINLYNHFRPEVRELKGLNIIDDRSFNYQALYGIDPQKKFAKPLPPVPLPKVPTIETVKKPTIAETQTTSDKLELELPRDLPKIGPIQKPPLEINETYYIMRITGFGSWIRGRLMQTHLPGSPQNKGQGVMYKVMELKQLKERLVTGKQIAYMTPSKVRLEVGTRVLAAFKEVASVGEMKKSRNTLYYPGVVAEPPVASNKHRYLIFFDIGYSQYVHYKLVNLILESSKNVWEDMAADSQAFIKKYLESQDHPMIKIAKDQTVRTEYNGKWWLCTVMNVDCSLVQVFFDALNRMEWIFRGSTRLSPIFREEQAASNRQSGNRTIPRKLGSNETATVVQYTRNSDFNPPPAVTTTAPTVRAVARKSTTKPQNTITPPTNAVPFLPVQNNNTSNSNGPTSKIMYFTPRDQVITKRPYRPHICTPKCKEYLTHNFTKLRGHNPLSKPLLCGWARMTVKVRGKKEIIYKAPCGRMLRHMGDIHYYLTVTKSEMTVDLFDFNHMVRCLAEFSVECTPDPKDLSNALEQVPIPVINGINSEELEFRNYSIERVPTEGVKMNLDPEYLCGCDCDDDCIDKTKCACWKLTLEGAKYITKDVDPNNVGYIYRRLNEQVLTGIYECNPRCKCGPTCLNRVVQHPLSLKLQVFRTHNRGWGIRALNDVPQGAFICCYAGTIHTEAMANEDGMAHGDEYFAELDYIESVEKVKEDYESDVPDDDDFEDRKSPAASEEEEEDEEREVLPRPTIAPKKRHNYSEDNDFIPANPLTAQEIESGVRRSLRKRTYDDTKDPREKDREPKPQPEKMEKMETNGSKDQQQQTQLNIKIKQELIREEEKDKTTSVDALAGEIDTVTISDDEDEEREILSFNPKSNPEEKKTKYVSVRELFGPDENVYVMDAKNAGNIGRFLNHSCSPNVFVQNVFVDTHDPRFPWVAFFSSQFIRAGTELVWNYNYDIGSVNGRVLYCHCASLECKGRLL